LDQLETHEKFGTGPIQTDELTAAVNAITLPEKMHLTKEQAFISKSMGVNLPFTPKFTREKKDHGLAYG
jgi:hypothetical protein